MTWTDIRYPENTCHDGPPDVTSPGAGGEWVGVVGVSGLALGGGGGGVGGG